MEKKGKRNGKEMEKKWKRNGKEMEKRRSCGAIFRRPMKLTD